MKSAKQQIGIKPEHPLTSKVASILESHNHSDNITNHAFHSIRNQLQVRVLLIQEFNYLPDCAACPQVWTKRGANPMTTEELKTKEFARIQELFAIKDFISISELSFDSHSVRNFIGRLKRAGWQIITNKDNGGSVSGYTLKHRPIQLKTTKKEKTPSLAGDGV